MTTNELVIAQRQSVSYEKFSQNREKTRSVFNILFDKHEIQKSPYRPDPKSWDNDTITAAWIGHATVLINFFGTTIITDPVFSSKIGIRPLGLFTLGPKRLVHPALTFSELPPIDLILLSHAHMDHLDIRSLKKFNKNTRVITAKNVSALVKGLGFKNVNEIDWNEAIEINGVTIEAFLVSHFGWRFPWEKDRSRGNSNGKSYNAYLISKNGKHIFFGGDTAYQEYFKSIGERNIPIELAMMPIGAYDPWIYVHANPEEAVAMANHMNAKSIMPIHWGTFILSSEPMSEPIERLQRALAKHSPTLAVDSVGQTWTLSR